MTITISYATPFMREPRKNLQPKKAVDPDDEVIVFKDSDEEDSVSGDEESSRASSSDNSSSSDGSSTYASTGGASKFSTANTKITGSGGTVTTKGTGSGDHVSEGDDSPRNFDDAENPEKIRTPQEEMVDAEGLDEEKTEPAEQERKIVMRRDDSELTLWDVIMRKRQELARARRNKALRFHERRYREQQEEEIRRQRLERYQAKGGAAVKPGRRRRIIPKMTMLEIVQRTMRDSVQQDIDRADKRLFGLKHMLGKWLVWDRDRLQRKNKDKSGELKEVVEQQEKMRKQAAREAEEEDAKLCSRMEELAASQAALRLLRRCGTYPAVRHTTEHDEEDTFETDTTVAIRPRPGAVLVITKPSHRGGSAEPPPHVSFFDHDLTRYRMMESLRGYGLGVTGGVALAEDLRREDTAQRLQVLDLRDCKIGRVGLEALGEALAAVGGRCVIHTLNLRGNELTGTAMKHFGECMAKGAIQYLGTLDLRNNLLGDAGAGHVASFLFHQSAPRLEYLYLQQNEIGNQGAVALYKVLVAYERWCPRLKEVHVRQNKVTKAAYVQMTHCPRVLDI